MSRLTSAAIQKWLPQWFRCFLHHCNEPQLITAWQCNNWTWSQPGSKFLKQGWRLWPFPQWEHISTVITVCFFFVKGVKWLLIRSVGNSRPASLTHAAPHVWNHSPKEILTKEQLPLTSRTLHTHTHTYTYWRNHFIESGETGLASALDKPRQINGFVLTLPIKPLTSLLELSQTSCLGRRLTTGPRIKKLKENPCCREEKKKQLGIPKYSYGWLAKATGV